MLFSLALIPSFVLLSFIYKKDTKEKEPIKLLLSCFMLGAFITFPAEIIEEFISYILSAFIDMESVPGAIAEGVIVAGFSEELLKFLVLRSKTWKSKDFDFMFDGIVYSVFVSLGFATLENMFYVMDGGLYTALLRMFTAIPGHMCFSVFMGYFYSLSKKAYLSGNIKQSKHYRSISLFVPILIHGIYDALLMISEYTDSEFLSGISFFFWFIIFAVLYIYSFIFINKSSKSDALLSPYSHNNGWICKCGNTSYGNYCGMCGVSRLSLF